MYSFTLNNVRLTISVMDVGKSVIENVFMSNEFEAVISYSFVADTK